MRSKFWDYVFFGAFGAIAASSIAAIVILLREAQKDRRQINKRKDGIT